MNFVMLLILVSRHRAPFVVLNQYDNAQLFLFAVRTRQKHETRWYGEPNLEPAPSGTASFTCLTFSSIDFATVEDGCCSTFLPLVDAQANAAVLKIVPRARYSFLMVLPSIWLSTHAEVSYAEKWPGRTGALGHRMRLGRL